MQNNNFSKMNSLLTEREKQDFFIKLYFNITNGFELGGIRRAYLDFNRTLKIIDNNRVFLKQSAENYLLTNLIVGLQKQFLNQEEFDKQHKIWCEELIQTWTELSYGQSQKWVNMTLKYWLLFGNERINSVELNAKYFHIPIDSYVQKGMFKEKTPKPWSKISDYKDYMRYQLEHRKKETGNHPIVDEFNFFNNYNPN